MPKPSSSVELSPPSWFGQVGQQVELTGTVNELTLVRAAGEGPGGTDIWNQVASPLGGVEVQLFSSPSPNAMPRTPVNNATTGSDGTFAFSVTSDATGTVYYQAFFGGRPSKEPLANIPGSNCVVWVQWLPKGQVPTTLTLDPVYDVTTVTGAGGAQQTNGLLKGQLTDVNGLGVANKQIVFTANTYQVIIYDGNCSNGSPEELQIDTNPSNVYTGENGEFQGVQVSLYSLTPTSLPSTLKKSNDNLEAHFAGDSTYLGSWSKGVSGIIIAC